MGSTQQPAPLSKEEAEKIINDAIEQGKKEQAAAKPSVSSESKSSHTLTTIANVLFAIALYSTFRAFYVLKDAPVVGFGAIYYLPSGLISIAIAFLGCCIIAASRKISQKHRYLRIGLFFVFNGLFLALFEQACAFVYYLYSIAEMPSF